MGLVRKILNLFGSVERTTVSKAQGVTSTQINPEAREIAELVTRMREDDQVIFAELTLKACIKRIDVFITTESEDPRAVAHADKLQALWERSLDDFLEAIAYGRSAFEKLYCYDANHNLRLPSCLEYLPFSLTKMELAEGRFNGIVVGKGDNKVTLTADESVWVAIDSDALNPHGRSRFLGAPYKVWQKRQKVVGAGGLEEKFLQRFALRGGVAHVEPTVTDEQTGMQIDNLAATGEAYQSLMSGGLMILPNTILDDGKYANDVTESPSALDPTPITNTVDKIDIRVLRAFGIPEKTVIDNGAGSWDLVSLQMLILWAVCEGLLGQMVDAFQEQVIDPSVCDNYPPESGIEIKATFTRPSQQPDSVLAEIAKALMTSGQLSPVVLSGGIDVRKILDAVGIPVTPDLENRLTVILSQLSSVANQVQSDPVDSAGPTDVTDPAPVLDPSAAPVPTDASNVAATALNGAQISSLVDVIGQITAGTIPVETGRQILYAAFPAVPVEQIDRIIKPLLTFEPPPLPSAAMANLQDGFPPDIPDQHDCQMSALANLDALFAKLKQAASNRDEDAVARICEQINLLHAQSRVAGQIIGRLTPIRPHLQAAPKGAGGRPTAIKVLANEASTSEYYYPFINDAAAYLRNKQVATDEEIQAIPVKIRHTMFTVPGIESKAILAQIRDAIAASTAAGETHEQFTERIESVVSLPEAQSRTLLRTEMKGAFVEGLDKTIQKPAVKAQLPYVRYVATRDARTRTSHAAMRDVVCQIDDPLYKVMLQLLKSYNCRCAIIPLSETQAKKYTIRTIDDVPAAVREDYGHLFD